MSIGGFRDLNVWQRSIEVAVEVYELTKAFPQEERYGLSSQLRRAVISISSNIAEGFVRSTAQDKKRFYTMAIGSNDEVQSQLFVAERLGYVEDETVERVANELIEIRKMIGGLQKTAVDF